MADNVELPGKILQFLMTEWTRKDSRQLVSVELLYAPGGGFREEPLRKWVRADDPDFFAEFTASKLVAQIIEIAEEEVDCKPVGRHRFVLRTQQHLGGRANLSFPLSPRCCGDETSSVPNGGGDYGPQGGDDAAREQIRTLTAENARLRRELEEARSNKLERELQLAMAMKMFEEVVNLIRPPDKRDGRSQPSPGRVNRERS